MFSKLKETEIQSRSFMISLFFSLLNKQRTQTKCRLKQGCQVKKNKKAKFGHKQFQKGQIVKNEKKAK